MSDAGYINSVIGAKNKYINELLIEIDELKNDKTIAALNARIKELEAWKEEALFYTPAIGNNKEKWQKTIATLRGALEFFTNGYDDVIDGTKHEQDVLIKGNEVARTALKEAFPEKEE